MSGATQAPVNAAGWWRPAAPAAAIQSPSDLSPKGFVSYRATMAFLFILVIAPQAFITALQPLRIAFVTAIVAICAFLFQRIAHREPLIELNGEIKLVGLLVAWAMLTIPFGLWPGGSVQFLLGMYLKCVALFLLLAHVVDTRDRLEKTAWVLTLMAIPVSLAGIRSFFYGPLELDRIVGYEAGLTANPNDLALMLNIMLPMALALFLGAKKQLTKVFLAAVIVLITAGVVVSFSRSGFLTLALVCAIYGWIMLKRRRYGMVVAALIAFLLAIPLVPASYVDRLATITSIEADESGSAQERWSDSFAAMKYVGANPVVGAGIGQSALAMNQVRGETWLRVHNIYLESAVDLGIPGLILVLLLVYRCTGAARQARAASSDQVADLRFHHVAEGVWVALIAFAFAGLFSPVTYQFYFYVLAGLALAARSIATGVR